MRVLCVSPLFPPTVNAESVCAAKWALALVSRGVDVTVIADPPPAEADRRDASSCWTPLAARTVAVEVPGDLRFFETLRLGWRYRLGRLYPRWVDRIVSRATELHREKPFDLVVSRSLPARAHPAGRWAARALGVPWAAVINDPWDYHLFPAGVLQGARDRRFVSNRWLRRTLREADALFGPSARLNDYNRRLARSDRRSDVCPHVGWAGGDAGASGRQEFRLVHAGVLGYEPLTGGRPASGLLGGFARFLAGRPGARADARLRLVGPEDPEAKALAGTLGLADAVTFAGRMRFEESLNEIASASAGVVVEARMEEGIYLPSKFTDYVAAGKPVLALSPAAGTIADFSAGEPAILRVDVDDEPAIERAIATLYDEWRRDGLASLGPSEKLQSTFRPETVADTFIATVEKVLRHPQAVGVAL